MLADIGLTVARSLPTGVVGGLLSGAYSLHGGVIRDAGGRIVSHLATAGASQGLNGLIPGASILNAVFEQGQLWKLGKDVAQVQSTLGAVLSVSTAAAALSGLGLITSIASVAYLTRRFNQTDAKLAVLEKGTKDIKEWLGSLQKSKLQFALDNVRHSESAPDAGLRRDLLLQSKQEFGMLAHHYKAEWVRCHSVDEIGAVNDLYVLAILGSATVCSNLGMHEEAAIDLRSNVADWGSQARLHTRAILFDDRPDRLLGAEHVDQLPARTLVALMDYAYDSDRGVDWLDDLRIGHGKNATFLESLAPLAPTRFQRLVGKGGGAGVVDLAQTLRTRADLLAANSAHYEFLNEKGVSATAFQRELDTARISEGTEAICVAAVETT